MAHENFFGLFLFLVLVHNLLSGVFADRKMSSMSPSRLLRDITVRNEEDEGAVMSNERQKHTQSVRILVWNTHKYKKPLTQH